MCGLKNTLTFAPHVWKFYSRKPQYSKEKKKKKENAIYAA